MRGPNVGILVVLLSGTIAPVVAGQAVRARVAVRTHDIDADVRYRDGYDGRRYRQERDEDFYGFSCDRRFHKEDRKDCLEAEREYLKDVREAERERAKDYREHLRESEKAWREHSREVEKDRREAEREYWKGRREQEREWGKRRREHP